MSRFLSASALVGVTFVSGHSWAFCQARSCDPDAQGPVCTRDPVTQCSNQGIPIKRPNGCLTYGVERGGGTKLGISDVKFNEIVADAFRLWAEVDCGGGPPNVVIRTVGAVDAIEPFTCRQNDLNLDTWFFADLAGSLMSGAANGSVAGVTNPRFNELTGEMVDADVRLNEPLFGSLKQDPNFLGLLATTITHEAGHVLGLAHSQDSSALMFKSYAVTPNRQLSPDDVAAICALYPPAPSLTCSEPGVTEAALNQPACEAIAKQSEGGCSVGMGCDQNGNTGCAGLVLVLAWGACRRGKRMSSYLPRFSH